MGMLANVAIFGGTVGLMRDLIGPRQEPQRQPKMAPKKKTNSMDFDFGCRL